MQSQPDAIVPEPDSAAASGDLIPNVLAERYATAGMAAIWSPRGKIRLERQLWLAVLKAQRDLGLEVGDEVIAAYERVLEDIDPASIQARERVTRHDVKARIEEFCHLAGHEHIHKGMTSRDLTENVEQLQVWRALEVVRRKSVATLARLIERVEADRDLPLTGRTHNVAAQLTTLGKRWAMFGDELLTAHRRLVQLIDGYRVRGLKGAVGTQMDALQLFDGDAAKVEQLEQRVLHHLGAPAGHGWTAVGQVYPRSHDFAVVSALCELASGPSNLAKTLRLMAGHELAGEGFAKGQVGSSAMPHKMNSRSCERINGFHAILKGHVTMASALAGDQWNEGDVSCSVVRRVVLPDAFLAIDGLLETGLVVLEQMEVFAGMIRREVDHYLPFLVTTRILMAAVGAGVGRELAHEVIKQHAVAAIRDWREGRSGDNDLLARLAGDDRLGLAEPDLGRLLEQGRGETGAAGRQIDSWIGQAREVIDADPAAGYRPGSIL